MKKLTVFILVITIVLSLASCKSVQTTIEVENGIVYFNRPLFTPEIILRTDEDIIIENDQFYEKLIEAVNEKPINSIDGSNTCECDIEYTVKISADYKSGYYFLFHDHGIEIQQYCKYRKCLDLYGVVEVDESTLRELIELLNN